MRIGRDGKGGLRENGWRQASAGLVGVVTHVVLQARRGEHGVEVDVLGKRCRGDVYRRDIWFGNG